MIDARTALLVGAAIASPWLLSAGAAAGIPIPVYITGGQRAALAAFPSTVAGISTMPAGDQLADTSSIYAKWNRVNSGLLAAQGAAVISEYANPLWNPTNIAKLSTSQARELGNAVLAAAGAGFAASTEAYWHKPDLIGETVALPDEYTALQGLLATDSVWGEGDQDDTNDIALAILQLVVECDHQGYLASGKPIVPDVGGAFAAAATAVEDFATGIAGKAAGAAIGLAAGAALSTPGLLAIAGVVLWKVFK